MMASDGAKIHPLDEAHFWLDFPSAADGSVNDYIKTNGNGKIDNNAHKIYIY